MVTPTETKSDSWGVRTILPKPQLDFYRGDANLEQASRTELVTPERVSKEKLETQKSLRTTPDVLNRTLTIFIIFAERVLHFLRLSPRIHDSTIRRSHDHDSAIPRTK